VAIWLHSRWFKDFSTLAPVVCSYKNVDVATTSTPLYNLSKRDWLFWCNHLDASTIVPARINNGRIAVTPPITEFELKNYQIWLSDLKLRAQNWNTVFEDLIPHMKDTEIETMLLEMKIPNNQWSQFIEGRPKSAKSRLQFVHSKTHPTRSVSIPVLIKALTYSYTVTEKLNGWYLDDGTQISDVMIRLDTIDGTDPFDIHHIIRAIFKHKTYELKIPHRLMLANKLAEAVELKLIQAKAGLPIFAESWKPYLYEIAKKLQRPKIIHTDKTKPTLPGIEEDVISFKDDDYSIIENMTP
jgi:hypothetical protein